MNKYLADQLHRRKRSLVSIIPGDDLKSIYLRISGDKSFYSPTEYRYLMLTNWDKYEEEIKNWISVCWEGW